MQNYRRSTRRDTCKVRKMTYDGKEERWNNGKGKRVRCFATYKFDSCQKRPRKRKPGGEREEANRFITSRIPRRNRLMKLFLGVFRASRIQARFLRNRGNERATMITIHTYADDRVRSTCDLMKKHLLRIFLRFVTSAFKNMRTLA